jgi:hypothetical protein
MVVAVLAEAVVLTSEASVEETLVEEVLEAIFN